MNDTTPARRSATPTATPVEARAQQLRLDQAPNHRHPLGRLRECLARVRDARLGLEAERVFTELAVNSHADGYAPASAATLAEALDADRANVKRALRALTRRGLVQPVALVAGDLVVGGPPHRRAGYLLPGMVAPLRLV